jgi:hypothetical protein
MMVNYSRPVVLEFLANSNFRRALNRSLLSLHRIQEHGVAGSNPVILVYY